MAAKVSLIISYKVLNILKQKLCKILNHCFNHEQTIKSNALNFIVCKHSSNTVLCLCTTKFNESDVSFPPNFSWPLSTSKKTTKIKVRKLLFL